MTGPFAIDHADITRLSDYQLTELLRRLLVLEAERLGISKLAVSVSLNINIPDGGQDGRFEWSDGPNPSGWLTRRLSVFQVKATEMGPADCGKEIVGKDAAKNDVLKPRVKDVVERGGAYVLFYGRPCEGDMVTRRVEAVREKMAAHSSQTAADAVEIVVLGAEKIAEWTSEYASATAYVLESTGKPIPSTLQRWEGWQREHPRELVLHLDDARQETLTRLRQHLSEPQKVARLLGLSGLGKSRLALEAFRPPPSTEHGATVSAETAEQAVLSASCVYASDGAMVGIDAIVVLRALVQRRARGTIVVDECPLELHKKLEQIVTGPGSRLSLLTLDYAPDGDPRTGHCEVFRIVQMDDADVEVIIRETDEQLTAEQVSQIAQMAQGFPRMAEFLVRAISDTELPLWELASRDVYERLVVRRSPRPDEVWKLAKGLAVFEHLGTAGDVKHQFGVLAEQVCGLEDRDAFSSLRELEEAGIAYRRGDWVRLTPLPLAITLAAEWWNDCSDDEAERLLSDGGLPPAMVTTMASQLRRLKDHPFAQRLMEQLYGPNGPFRARSFLDSAHGSRVTSSLAETSPSPVADALVAVFDDMSPDEARGVQAGRRHLVWALEKLAWWPESFNAAATVLMLFAAGENEKIANNATGQFLQLFHVRLSGTEVPAGDRLQVVQDGLSMDDPEIETVCVEALLASLSWGHFSRIGGADTQGFGVRREDWAPTTYGEIWDYWGAALDLLNPYLLADTPLGERARDGLAAKVRGVIRTGAIRLVERTVDRVLRAGLEWASMLAGLRSALNYDGKEYHADLLTIVQGLIRRLEPSDLGTRLRLTVATPEWGELRKEEDGSVTVVPEERAKSLAAELALDPSLLEPHWHTVLTGEQRQGYKFGLALGERVDNPKQLLETATERLAGVAEGARNGAVVVGIANAVGQQDSAWLRAFILRMFGSPALRTTAVDMMRSGTLSDEDIVLVAGAIESGDLDVRVAHNFTYGGVLEPISAPAMAQLVDACVDSGELGRVIALEVMGMKLHRRDLEDDLLPCVAALTSHRDVLEAVVGRSGGGSHHFEGLVDRVLGHNARPDDYVATLARHVVEQLTGDHWLSSLLRNLLKKLLLQEPGEVWPLVRRGIETGTGAAVHRLFLGLEDIFKAANVVDAVGDDELISWARSSPQALHLVARMIRPLGGGSETGDYPSWTPFAQRLLLEFGASEDLRSGLYSSTISGGWAGSMVPRLESRKSAFEELRRHPVREVRRWARETVEGLDSWIEQEQKRDEEREFGIYR